VGFVYNVRDVLKSKILKNDLIACYLGMLLGQQGLGHRNKRFRFKSDIQESREKLDTIPGTLKHNDNQPKQRSRNPDEVSNRTRSNTGSQNNGDRTRSKVHAMSSSYNQGKFFPLNT
jgi:hypothetical protein